MLKFIKWLLIISVVVIGGSIAFVSYQLKQYEKHFQQDKPLDIKQVEVSQVKSQTVSHQVTHVESGYVKIKNEHLDYLLYSFLNHPDVQKELMKGDEGYRGYVDDLDMIGGSDIHSQNIRFEQLKSNTSFTAGGGRISLSAPYRNKRKHLNVIIRFTAKWPAKPGEIRVDSIRLGDKNIFDDSLIGQKLKEGLDAALDEEIARILAEPSKNPLLRLDFVEGAARFKLKPKAQRELLRFMRNVLLGKGLAFPADKPQE